MTDAEFDTLVAQLLGETPPRVWSLLVTIFGDLALDEGAKLSGTCLNALTSTLGIKPEATRVALHRLRKEGWITSERIGRQSRYALTEDSRAKTRAAHPRVYNPEGPSQWPALVLEDPTRPMAKTTAKPGEDDVRLGSHILLSLNPPECDRVYVQTLSAEDKFPDWVLSKVCLPEVIEFSQRLATDFESITSQVTKPSTLLQRCALRAVIVHEWRRLVLKVPYFRDALMPDDWQGPRCRALFTQLLEHFPAPDLAQLEAHVSS